MGENERAKEAYHRALALTPGSADILHQLALIHIHQRDCLQAKTYADQIPPHETQLFNDVLIKLNTCINK
jgi:Tfp pilus assembly protein PilF